MICFSVKIVGSLGSALILLSTVRSLSPTSVLLFNSVAELVAVSDFVALILALETVLASILVLVLTVS